MTVRTLLTVLFGTIGGLPAIERHERNLLPRWREINGQYPDLPDLSEMVRRLWIIRHNNRALTSYEKGRSSFILDSTALFEDETKETIKPSGGELLLQLDAI